MKRLYWLLFSLCLIYSNTLEKVSAQSSSSNKLIPNATRNGQFFEENKGQFAPEVRFLLREPGLDIWITNSGVVYDRYDLEYLSDDSTATPLTFPVRPFGPPHERTVRRTGQVVRMEFLGSNKSATTELGDSLAGIRNYFFGSDPAKWVTQVRSFEGFEIKNVYNGIDAEYSLDGGSLRYDLLVQSGVDPNAITLKFVGATKLLAAQSRLTIRTALGDLEEAALEAYQMIEGKKCIVNCKFKVMDDSTVRFVVGAHDRFAALVIDPLVYSTFLGNSGEDEANAIVVDRAHNAYVTGFTTSPSLHSFPVTAGAYQVTNSGTADVFVTKLDPSGSNLVYSTYLGGAASDVGTGIAIDQLGDAYITGTTSSRASIPPGFPTTAAAFQAANNGLSDAFLTKLGPRGDMLLFSTYLGGTQNENGSAVAVDMAGNAYVVGGTVSTGSYPAGYPTTASAFQTAQGGVESGFVTKFSSAGVMLYSTYLGGKGLSEANSVAVDQQGYAFVTGTTNSVGVFPVGFPTTLGAFQQTVSGGLDAFVARLNPSGTSLAYSTCLGGASDDVATGITIDPNGNAYITGFTSSSGAYPTGYPTTAAAFQPIFNGVQDAFVTKLNASGTALVYSTYLGGAQGEVAHAIALDSTFRACVTGYTSSTGIYPAGYPVSKRAFQTQYNGGGDDFVTVLTATGSSLSYSTLLGGKSDESGYGIACDDSGFVYLAGGSASMGNYPTGFPTTALAFQRVHGGGKLDATVTKLAAGTSLLNLETDPLYFGLCDTGRAGVWVSNFGLVTVIIDSISMQPPLLPSTRTFPISVPPDSEFEIRFNYAPRRVGSDSGFVVVHYRANGVSHDSSILVRALVGNGIKLAIPNADTLRGTLCGRVQQSIRIRDSGCEEITILQYILLGSHGDLFSVSGALPSTVNSNKESQVTIGFGATQPGTYYEKLDIRYLTSNGVTRDTIINLIAIINSTSVLTWGSPSKIKGNICDSLIGRVNFLIAGCQDLIVTGRVLTGPDGGRFHILNTFPFTLPHDTLGEISLAMLYRVPGTYHCTLTIFAQSTDGVEHDTTFAFTATITPGAGFTFTKSLSFVGSTCDSMIGLATIASVHCGALQVLGATITGADSASFAILTTFPAQISGNDSLHIAIKNSGLQQRTYTATLHVRYVTTDGITHDTTIDLSATLQPLAPKLIALNDLVDLGAVQDCLSADTSITLRNFGCDTLRIDSLQSAMPTGLSFIGVTFPILLAPNGQVRVRLHYQPQGTTPFLTDLAFHATEQGRTATTDVRIEATPIKGTSTLATADTTIDFGSVSVCSNRSLWTKFSSVGCDSVDVSGSSLGSANGFAVVNGHPSSLAPGVSDSLLIQFVPPSSGPYSDDLVINSSAGTKRIHLRALGIPDSGRVELSTTALVFASATASCDSTATGFTLRNTSCSAITIDSVKLTGAGSAAFKAAFALTLPAVIATDSSLQVSGLFTPAMPTTYMSTLTIWYHTAAGKLADTTIRLTGLGTNPPMIGIVMKSKPLKGAADGTVDIPIYLIGKLDAATAKGIGLQSVTIKLSLNTDLLTPTDVQSSLTLPTKPTIQTDRSSATITVMLPNSLSFSDTTELLTLHCRAFITDTMRTAVTLMSSKYTATTLSQCLQESLASGQTSFSISASCDDTLLSNTIGRTGEFFIQSVSPNPTTSRVQVLLVRRTNSPIQYVLRDALGKSVEEGTMEQSSNWIDLKQLPSGIFYLRLSTPKTIETRKIVVQH